MNLGQIATTLDYETSSYVSYVINTEGLVSIDDLSAMAYTTALTSYQMNTLFPITEINE